VRAPPGSIFTSMGLYTLFKRSLHLIQKILNPKLECELLQHSPRSPALPQRRHHRLYASDGTHGSGALGGGGGGGVGVRVRVVVEGGDSAQRAAATAPAPAPGRTTPAPAPTTRSAEYTAARGSTDRSIASCRFPRPYPVSTASAPATTRHRPGITYHPPRRRRYPCRTRRRHRRRHATRLDSPVERSLRQQRLAVPPYELRVEELRRRDAVSRALIIDGKGLTRKTDTGTETRPFAVQVRIVGTSGMDMS